MAPVTFAQHTWIDDDEVEGAVNALELNRHEQAIADVVEAINNGGSGIVNVLDFADIEAAVAVVESGDTLYLPPSATVYATDALLTIPAGVGIYGPGATLRFNDAAGGLYIEDPQNDIFVGFAINGADVCLNPLTIGSASTWNGTAWVVGSGSKSCWRDVWIQNTGTGGTVARLRHLQNSVFDNFRLTNNDLATTGLLIDDGTKNVFFYGTWPSDINGPNIKVTTSQGDQRTSKIYFFGGLAESIGFDTQPLTGVRLEDCEQIYFYAFALNGGDATDSSAFHLTSGGNRDTNADGTGNGAKGPNNIVIREPQVSSYTNYLRVDTNSAVQTGGEVLNGIPIKYKVENASARITEISPTQGDATARYASVAAHPEHNAIIPIKPYVREYEIGGETTAVTATTMKTFRMPFAVRITKVSASLTTASTSGNPTVDIQEAGVTILGTNKLRIDANEKTSETAGTATSIADGNLAADAEMTIVGTVAGTGAAGLKVTLQGYRT